MRVARRVLGLPDAAARAGDKITSVKHSVRRSVISFFKKQHHPCEILMKNTLLSHTSMLLQACP